MAGWERYEQHIVDICSQWDIAEEDIKLAEQVADKVITPAVKELRYAGRRIVEALSQAMQEASEETVTALFQDAHFNCLRARHDAIDAATAQIAVNLKIAEAKIGYDAILKAMPDFRQLYIPLNEIRKQISKSRRDRKNREAMYASVEAGDFKTLVDNYNAFKASENMMRSLAASDRRKRAISYGLYSDGNRLTVAAPEGLSV